MRSFLQKITRPFFILGSWTVILLSGLCYLAPFISPQVNRWLPFFGLIYPLIAVAQVFFVIWGLYFRRRTFWMMSLVFLLGSGHFTKYIALSWSIKSPDATRTLRILSYNTHFMDIANQTQEYEHKIQKVVEQTTPTIVCFQEFYYASQTDKDKAYKKSYPYTAVGSGYLRIFSKYPILDSKVLSFNGEKFGNVSTGNSGLYADIQVSDDKIIRVFNVHFQSIRLGNDADELLDDITPEEQQTQSRYLRVVRKLSKAYRIRALQADFIAKQISKSPYPVILCGDFNDTPVSYTYNKVSEGLTDAFKQRGWGIGSTYAGELPGLRIDYIFTDKKLTPYTCAVKKIGSSDHYPVVSDIGF